ncbi:MAG: four helix bundle protein [Chloroflexi bacterium]|nr:four helix bundle protein [Chloroflexota bacterium]MBU1749850.1 four helix bundle protein [Chloroflexota bacterium]MBU1877771.1 four helix bundle protein [Chloroflexota bacterium]
MKNYEELVATVPAEIRADSLWKVAAYRLALFLSDLGWRDTAKLVQNRRLIGLSDQLYRALGSVSANIAEGYSRGTGPDRARFYEYALGSARESRDWYYKARYVLGEEVFQHRLQLLTRAIQLLLIMIPQQRGRVLREQSAIYQTVPELEAADPLLQHIPLPDDA